MGNVRKKLICSAMLVASMFSVTTASETDSFRNPILTGMNPDPTICRVGDDFYLMTSTFEYFPGLPIYHSKDLVNWKLIGHALSTPRNNPLKGAGTSGGQYAPTLRYQDGTFYVIGTNYGGEGSHGISIVSAKDPAGPWSDPVWLDQWWVDPSLDFYDGKAYYLSPDNAGNFLLGTIDVNTGKEIESRRQVASGLGGASPEGPHFYKIGEYYYIMSAEGGTGYEHREVIQRSKNPYGPYEPNPINPVLSNMNVPNHPFQAIGHADLVQLQDGSWWAVCLGIRPQNGKYQHIGRETFLAPVTWTEDGWPKVGDDGVVAETYRRPDLPLHKWDKDPVRDDFDKAELNLFWYFLRNPYAKDWSLTERPGHLRLNGSSLSFRQNDSPAFVGRRQTALNAVASAKVDFNPVSENEEAGLVIRGNDKNHYDLLITKRDGRKVAIMRQYLNDKEASLKTVGLPDGEVVLRIKATPDRYDFYVDVEGGKSVLLDSATTKNLANEVITGFTGVFIGMYASGNGKDNTNPADFDWFDFEELDY